MRCKGRSLFLCHEIIFITSAEKYSYDKLPYMFFVLRKYKLNSLIIVSTCG